jgi:hypothetical protein
MRKRLAFVPLYLLLVGAAPAPPAPTPTEQIAMASVRAHVEFLADDLLEGRDTGSRGHAIAARYVASRFREMGLEPGGTNGSWLTDVPLRRATTAATPTVTITTPGGTQSLRWAADVTLRPSLTEAHRALTAPLVFVGYGLDEPLLGLDDYHDVDVRGAIVVALDGTPNGLPTEIAAHVGSTRAEAAARHGAVGLITLAGTGRDRGDVASGARPAISWIDPAGRTGDSSGLRTRLTLSPDWQRRIFDGAPTSLKDIRAQVVANVRPAGFALPGRITLSADSSWTDFTSPEVIARLPGTDPVRASENVVLMAHLDHLGVKPDAQTAKSGPGEDRIYNGALDNAAGVATMLEAAREFVASGRRPARSILFIANTGEEKGLLGADYLAAHPPVPPSSIVSVVDLDMPLPLYDFTDVIAFGADHSTLARTVALAGKGMGIGVSPDPMPQESIFVRSDHYSFVRRGVPAILLMTGYANGGEPVWKHFMAKVYHSPADDLSQPIMWRSLARYGMLNYAIARALADDPVRPRWYAGDYFGDRFAPGEPRASRLAP